MLQHPHYIVRRLQPTDAPSFYAAVRESIDKLTYWMLWCSKDYLFIREDGRTLVVPAHRLIKPVYARKFIELLRHRVDLVDVHSC